MLLVRERLEEVYSVLRKETPFSMDEILSYVITIHRVCQVSTFTTMMLERNMSRILVCLLLLCEQKESEGAKKGAEVLLEEIMTVKNKLVLVKGLRSLLRGSITLRKRAVGMLTALLLEEGGLDAVLQAHLEGLEESNGEAQAGVAKLITSVPVAMDKVIM